jgi:hypothetical protein
MKTYYMFTPGLTFYIQIKEGQTFYQDIAETLMSWRGFGCTEYNFSMTNSNESVSINVNLTESYNSYYNEFIEYYK